MQTGSGMLDYFWILTRESEPCLTIKTQFVHMVICSAKGLDATNKQKSNVMYAFNINYE